MPRVVRLNLTLRPGGPCLRLGVLLLALPLMAASPPNRGISLQVPSPSGMALPVPPRPPPVPPAGAFEPAPLPNRGVDAPSGPRESTSPSLAPSLFTRSDTYRGEGFSKGSTAVGEQERRVKPGAGFNLTVPFAPR